MPTVRREPVAPQGGDSALFEELQRAAARVAFETVSEALRREANLARGESWIQQARDVFRRFLRHHRDEGLALGEDDLRHLDTRLATTPPQPGDDEAIQHARRLASRLISSWLSMLDLSLGKGAEVKLGADLQPTSGVEAPLLTKWRDSLRPFATTDDDVATIWRGVAKGISARAQGSPPTINLPLRILLRRTDKYWTVRRAEAVQLQQEAGSPLPL